MRVSGRERTGVWNVRGRVILELCVCVCVTIVTPLLFSCHGWDAPRLMWHDELSCSRWQEEYMLYTRNICGHRAGTWD